MLIVKPRIEWSSYKYKKYHIHKLKIFLKKIEPGCVVMQEFLVLQLVHTVLVVLGRFNAIHNL